MKKVIFAILIAALAALTVYLIWDDRKTDIRMQAELTTAGREIYTLESEIESLKNEWQALTGSTSEEEFGDASVTLLYTDMSENIRTQILPVLGDSFPAGMQGGAEEQNAAGETEAAAENAKTASGSNAVGKKASGSDAAAAGNAGTQNVAGSAAGNAAGTGSGANAADGSASAAEMVHTPGGYHYPGMLAVSEKHFPGTEGCLTVAEYEMLLQNSWSSCLYWGGNKSDAAVTCDPESLEKWYGRISGKFEAAGLKVPDTVYFSYESYDDSLDEKLLSLGIKNVIHHGEQGHSRRKTETDGDLHLIGSSAWNKWTDQLLANLVNVSGGAVISVGSGYREQPVDDTNRAEFKSLMELLKYYEKNGLRVLNPDEARDYAAQKEADRAAAAAADAARLTEIEAALTEKQARLAELYKSYKGKKK